MPNTNLFEPLAESSQGRMLARHMPIGELWRGCFDEGLILGKLVKALGGEYYRLESLIKLINEELNINTTDLLLPEWEASVGIPDQCFLNTSSKQQRRTQVRLKYSKFGGVQKAEDFVRVASELGFTAVVISSLNTITINISGIPPEQNFPLPFPIPFALSSLDFLRCLFNKLAPANIEVIVNAV